MAIQVPYLPEEAIERDSEGLLAEFSQARGIPLTPPIPIDDIVEKHLELRLDFGDLHESLDVQQTGTEPDIFGALWVNSRQIYIHERLDPGAYPAEQGRYRFTLAHEGGHWRLHRRYLVTDPDQLSLSSDASKPSVICRSSQAKERIEWQADYFSSCLLMPAWMILKVWKRELDSHFPMIYDLVKDSPLARRPKRHGPRPIFSVLQEPIRELLDKSNVPHSALKADHGYLFYNVAKYFAPIFGVSVQAMCIRLQTLDLLLVKDPRQRPSVVCW